MKVSASSGSEHASDAADSAPSEKKAATDLSGKRLDTALDRLEKRADSKKPTIGGKPRKKRHPRMPSNLKPVRVPSDRAADRSTASGSAADLASVASSATDGLPDGLSLRNATTAVKAAAKRAETPSEVKHAERAVAQIDKTAVKTARHEALAREHGADLSEEGFDELLRKVGRAPVR